MKISYKGDYALKVILDLCDYYPDQMVHIEDIADVYIHMLDHPELTGTYNAGFENLSIMEIAKKVTQYVPAEITVEQSNDPRSYRVNSDKLLATGYKPKKTVDNAIQEIISKFHPGELEDKDCFYNLKWMRKTVLA